MLARHGLNLEVFAVLLISVAHQLRFYIQGHLTYLASVEEQSLPRNVGAKNYLFLREDEWLLELRQTTVAPTAPFGSMYMDVGKEARGAAAPFERYELESAG